MLQRQIAGPVHGGIGTGVTGRAQEEVSEKAPAELGLGQRGVEGSAVVEPYLEAALPLTGQLAAELDGHRLLALDVDCTSLAHTPGEQTPRHSTSQVSSFSGCSPR